MGRRNTGYKSGSHGCNYSFLQICYLQNKPYKLLEYPYRSLNGTFKPLLGPMILQVVSSPLSRMAGARERAELQPLEAERG